MSVCEVVPLSKFEETLLEVWEGDSAAWFDMRTALVDIKVPHWERRSRVHDWRNYIPTFMQETWDEIPRAVQLYAYLKAQDDAHDERWD